MHHWISVPCGCSCINFFYPAALVSHSIWYVRSMFGSLVASGGCRYRMHGRDRNMDVTYIDVERWLVIVKNFYTPSANTAPLIHSSGPVFLVSHCRSTRHYISGLQLVCTARCSMDPLVTTVPYRTCMPLVHHSLADGTRIMQHRRSWYSRVMCALRLLSNCTLDANWGIGIDGSFYEYRLVMGLRCCRFINFYPN